MPSDSGAQPPLLRRSSTHYEFRHDASAPKVVAPDGHVAGPRPSPRAASPTATSPRRAAEAQAVTYERMHVVLDQSGSMGQVAEAVYEGMRELLACQPEHTTVRLTTFSDRVTTGTGRTPRECLQQLRERSAVGRTALYDAIRAASAIELAIARRATATAAGVLVIVTDGIDNASAATVEQARADVEALRESGWHVLFLGSQQDAVLEARKFGVGRDTALTFGHCDAGVHRAMRSVACITQRIMSQGSRTASFTIAERQASLGGVSRFVSA